MLIAYLHFGWLELEPARILSDLRFFLTTAEFGFEIKNMAYCVISMFLLKFDPVPGNLSDVDPIISTGSDTDPVLV